MASEPKRRKTPQPPPRRIENFVDTMIPVAQTSGINLRIEQAKTFAVAQAQQDGCTGNYRIFDSPFANFLVPVIPTRAELFH
ncbi:TRNA-2-methylthio-N(6)-dimethylallyladenosine synthase [Senna tora]|uniref:tRNA-2-methylthio-N(6)-dimethylallyladenosine synthase n=1 Tax=Senna tora TaxID=362788 RepID=A0A834TBI6_9FABA|nr:TRNA-2-methylthio-N(6)-dimethylallyladenosine synthase [Senna tora]